MAIFKRGDRYRVQVSFPDGIGGYNRINKTARTKKEAIQIESNLMNSFKIGATPMISFEDLSADFLRSIKDRLRTSTYLEYKKNIRLYIIPFFGKFIINKVSSGTILYWKETIKKTISKKTNKPLSLCSLGHVWKALRLLYTYAKKIYGISDSEFCKVTPFQRDPNEYYPEKTFNVWSPEEFWKWYKAINKEFKGKSQEDPSWLKLSAVKTFVAICFWAGLRKGEANSLKIGDLHLNEKVPFIRIDKSVAEKTKTNPNKEAVYQITPPKSKSSCRDVPIPNVLVEIILDHVNGCLKRLYGYSPDFFLCGGIRPIPDTTIDKTKRDFENKAKVKHIRIHDLRHSYVSMLINKGVNYQIVSSLVGHSDPAITWRVYSHLYPEVKSDAVLMLDKFAPISHHQNKKALK